MLTPVENEDQSAGGLKPLHRQRLKIPTACHPCRQRKIKCDGGRPECRRCQKRGKSCAYARDSLIYRQQSNIAPQVAERKQASITLPSAPSPQGAVADSPISLRTKNEPTYNFEALQDSEPISEDQGPDAAHNRAFYTAHGHFAGEVAAAIDVRAGLAPNTISTPVPFVDAPLFGEMTIQSIAKPDEDPYQLPPRAYADRLIGTYWQRVDPVEPVLDRERFSRDYEATYNGSNLPPREGNDIWLCTLNIVFAVAVQRQESTPPQNRNDEANHYFQRAWTLLRPEIVLWKPSSLELVQCLMLMNRYLHCTINQHHTWMTAGLAMRLAQIVCFQQSSIKESAEERRSKQRVWTSCVGLDRCVSWSIGKTTSPTLVLSPSWASLVGTGKRYPEGSDPDEPLRRSLELYEINIQIQLAQTQTRNRLANRLGLPRLYQQEDYHSIAVQLDTCLNSWEDRLPNDLKLQALPGNLDRTARMRGYILHCRFLLTRIWLFRPMLVRLYTMKSQTPPAPAKSSLPSLSDRLLKHCASMCVEAAQKLTSLIIETLEPDESMGLLPWWYRIYMLHIAGTNFLAAMLESDLFTQSTIDSFQNCVAGLRAHAHLTSFVPQCVQSFETLYARVLKTRSSNDAGISDMLFADEDFSALVDDIFQDVNFDFNDILFGTGDTLGMLPDYSQ